MWLADSFPCLSRRQMGSIRLAWKKKRREGEFPDFDTRLLGAKYEALVCDLHGLWRVNSFAKGLAKLGVSQYNVMRGYRKYRPLTRAAFHPEETSNGSATPPPPPPLQKLLLRRSPCPPPGPGERAQEREAKRKKGAAIGTPARGLLPAFANEESAARRRFVRKRPHASFSARRGYETTRIDEIVSDSEN